MFIPSLFIAASPNRGLGIFTSTDIEPGTQVEISPVIVMTAEERKLLDQTTLHDYIFEWGHDKTNCCMALGYIAIYNHSYQSNCEYEMDYDQSQITIKSVHHIKAGEELFINYNGDWDDQKPVWFKVS